MFETKSTIEPLWVVRGLSEKGYGVKSHRHLRYFQMMYTLSGCFELVVNGREYALRDNMIHIARPGDIHSLKNSLEQPVETIEVKFTVSESNLKYALRKLPDIIPGSSFAKIMFEKIAQEKKEVNEYYQEYIGLYLTTLLYDIVRTELGGLVEEPKDQYQGSPTQIAKKYIHENYFENLSLDVIAEATYFNKSYLSTVFKMNEGLTISDYIFKYRTYKACELIAYSDVNLDDVSKMVGFKTSQHFCRIFKKYIGIPPKEYRNVTAKEIVLYEKLIPYDETDFIYNLEVLPVRAGHTYVVNTDTGYFRCKDSLEEH